MSRPAVERLTPPGAGGVAVLAVRGERALGRLVRLLARPLPSPGRVALGSLRDPDADDGAPPIDEALVVARADGAIEVHLHGSPAVVAEVAARLGGDDVTGASGGAPSLEERAERAASAASTGDGARILLDQAGGALRAALLALRDATDEERAQALGGLARRGRRCARLWRPATVVLSGPVNAGKSTLLNTLAGEEVATVTDEPGTTRDALGVEARLGPWPVVLVDTAGRRALDDAVAAGDRAATVEREGQALGQAAEVRADVVLRLEPATRGGGRAPAPGLDADGRVVRLRTRAAPVLGPDPAAWGAATVSALEAPEHARRVVAALAGALLDPGPSNEPLRTPGAAVPFEPGLVARLADLATSGRVTRSTLDSLLGGL